MHGAPHDCQSGSWKFQGSSLSSNLFNFVITDFTTATSTDCTGLGTDSTKKQLDYSFTTTGTQVVMATVSTRGYKSTGVVSFESTGGYIYLDGIMCGMDRSLNYGPGGGRLYSSASCIKSLAAGSHSLRFCQLQNEITSEADVQANVTVLK